jgi:hypothetical protein
MISEGEVVVVVSVGYGGGGGAGWRRVVPHRTTVVGRMARGWGMRQGNVRPRQVKIRQ